MADLRENEIKALLSLQRLGGKANTIEISKESGLNPAALMRAALTLKDHELVRTSERSRQLLRLSEEGTSYCESGLPERRVVEAAVSSGGKGHLQDLLIDTGTSEKMASIVLGWIKRKKWAEISKTENQIVIQVDKIPAPMEDEQILRTLSQQKEVYADEIPDPLKLGLVILKGRKLVEVVDRVQRTLELTDKGLEVLKEGIQSTKEATVLTSSMIVDGSWRNIRLRRYDVTASPPEIYPGKKHPFAEFIDRAREVLTEMGFEESEGPYVETEFWNFDVLFQAQDHPAREIHDSYILNSPKSGIIEYPELAKRVAQTHQNGWKTGSIGWGYKWSPEKARRLVLRTQTTAVSMRYLAEHKQPPVKMYCLSKIFRPDVMDATHIQEPHQLDGIVGDKGITLRHLLGFLREFAKALNLGEVKFQPHYFPFTEPSVESYIRHPKLGWVEFVGSGVFRPEVLRPLGIEFPVIAWGIGLDRLAMIALGTDDIRDLYSRKLDWLREKPLR